MKVSTRGVALGALVSVACMFGCGQDGTTDNTDTGTTAVDTDTSTTDTDTTTDPNTTLTVYQVCEDALLVPPIWSSGTFTATEAQLCNVGQAIADENDYVGTDSVWAFPLFGPYEVGAAVCILSYDLAPTAPRDDCSWGPTKPCDWAYDLEISNATVQDPLGLCLSTVGYDGTTVSTLNGTVFARGYHSDYSGHATVRMEIINESWRSAGYVEYDPATDVFTFADLDGNAVPL